MRILITGASGLLGLNLALEAAAPAKGHTVFGLANQNRPTLHPTASCPMPVTFLTTDLLAPDAVERLLDETQPDWVIHCAALANVDACEKDAELAQRLNAEIPGKLARHVGRGGARLLHISTDFVFDGVRGNYTEEDQPNPLSVYSHSKLAGERAVLEADPAAIVARVNLFGWSRSGRRSLAEFFFNSLSAGQPVKGFYDVFFCPLLANDLADVLLRMLEAGLSGLYHVVSPTALNKYEFGLAIARRFGLDPNLISPISVQDAGLAAALPGDLPTWQSGLERLYQLYQAGYPQWLAE